MNKKSISGGVAHKVPSDVRTAFVSLPQVREPWEGLTPLARNEWICWIKDAKKAGTRIRRIERTCSDLLKGKRRPCCWAGCPHR